MERFNLHEAMAPLRDKVRPVIARELEEGFSEKGVDGFYDFGRKYLEAVNVQPKFAKESDPKFKEWRDRLNTGRGIMISNHPSIIDGPLLSTVLTRPDIKIVVNNALYEETKGMSINRLLVSALKEGKSLADRKKMWEEMKTHLKWGGLLWIFPTGGVDMTTEDFHFAPGFSHLINELGDDDFVYSFHIDREDVAKNVNLLSANSGVVADFQFNEVLNMNRYRDTKYVTVDESVSDASVWKKLAADAGKGKANEALTDHYLDTFNLDRKDLHRIDHLME